ncbi:MAG: allophanate hydrolase subunit 1 [Planctomycetota bacterium]
MPRFRITHHGDRAVRIEFDAAAIGRAPSLAESLRTNAPPWLVDAVATARVALVVFDPAKVSVANIWSTIETLASEGPRRSARVAQTHTIPACYHSSLAPDLEPLAADLGMTTGELIALHTSAEYTVESLGFQPGFAYLAGLPAQLCVPRFPEPRPRVAAGSVGIAGERTGVYPHQSPGGWRLIARTAVEFFSPANTPPALLGVGDTVRFESVSLHHFSRIGAAR